MIVRSYDLDLVPSRAMQIIYASQYDDGLSQINFNLYALGNLYTIPEDATAIIQGTKPDGKGFSYSATIASSRSSVSFTITKQMTPVAGNVKCEIKIVQGTDMLHSAKFILSVDKAALGSDTDISETDLPGIIALASEQEANAAASATAAATSETNAKTSETNAALSATAAANSAASAQSLLDLGLSVVDGQIAMTIQEG